MNLNPNYQYLNSWEWIIGTIIFMIIAYLIGSLNMGQILSKTKQVDLGKYGSKNYGASNAGRAYGIYGFVLVFLFDFLKGIFAGLILTFLKYTVGNNFDIKIFIDASIPLALFFVCVGHSWPVFFKFKGGKGVATAFGVFTIVNFAFAALGGIMFLIVFFSLKKKYVFIPSIVSVLFVSVLLIFQPMFDFWNKIVFPWAMDWSVVILGFSLTILIISRHQQNFKNFVDARKSKN